MQGAGIAMSGLHWLLVAPAGLSITSADAAVRERTLDVMRRLIELCAELGGHYLVHGSPAQRRVSNESNPVEAARRAEAAWAAAAADAARAGVVYCIEPLAAPEADFVNTLAEAAAIVRRIGLPALRTMIDTSAAARWRGAGRGRDPALDADRPHRPCPAQRPQPPRAGRGHGPFRAGDPRAS